MAPWREANYQPEVETVLVRYWRDVLIAGAGRDDYPDTPLAGEFQRLAPGL
jgi:hypothetical protein